MVEMKCPKCGAPFEYEPGMKFKKCEFCGTMIYIDKSRVMFYYIIPFTIKDSDIPALFRRWASGPKMAKGLENSRILSVRKMYFPVYRFVRDLNGREAVFVKPAKTTLLPGLSNLKIPPGNMQLFDANFNPGNAKVIQPDLSMDTYLKTLQGTPKEQALVFFPLYEVRYEFQGKPHVVVIDGSSGEAFSAYYPPRSSAPYIVVAGASFGLAFIGSALALKVTAIGAALIGAAFLIGILGGFVVAKKF